MILQVLIAMIAGWINRRQQQVIDYQQEEIRILKAKLGGQRIRFTDAERRRLAALAFPIDRKQLKSLATLATPDTLMRWYKQLVAQKFDGSQKRNKLGRPRVSGEIEALVLQMANDNPTWGYRRIQGALANIGHDIDKITVRNILRRNHIDPAPMRGQAGISWSQFLKFHWAVLDASGFFEAQLSKMMIFWASSPRLARKFGAWGSQLLGRVFDHTLGVLTHVAQERRTLGSRYPSFNAQHPCILGQRAVSKAPFQFVTRQVKVCFVEQDHSPPEPRRVVIGPDDDFNRGRGATHPRFVTNSDADRERGQRFNHRRPMTVEHGVYPVAA